MNPVGTETTRAGDGHLVWKNTAQRQERTFLPPPDQCPLAPSALGRPTEVPADNYDVVVFENRFPSLRGASTISRYLDVLCRFDRLFGTPAPYIAAWHQAPVTDAEARQQFGLHLQVFTVRRAQGRLKYLAGTESGMAV
jgi:galactose-1-phosphate uridylyltransferase